MVDVAIVNYGMGNLASVFRAVETIGHAPFIADYPQDLRRGSRIVLPGVGAFVEGMRRLDDGGWSDELHSQVAVGRPLLGICLGMQFLAEHGDEGGPARAGLGFVGGAVRPLAEIVSDERIPHVGWNELHYVREDVVFGGIPDQTDFYFVHSYALQPTDPGQVLATVRYGGDITAAVRHDNVWGAQFHPEKSSKAGLHLLRNFIERS